MFPSVYWAERMFNGRYWAKVGCTLSYTPSLDHAGDSDVWDNVQTVTLTSVRDAGDLEVCVSGAHRHQITRKELAASNGVYTPDDVVWRLPAQNTSSTRPKPRDRVTDAEGTSWTILEVARIVALARYRCVCRDLVLAADLRDTVRVYSCTNTQDAGAGRLPQFSLSATVVGRFQEVQTDQEDRLGKRTSRKLYDVFVASLPAGLSTDDQLRDAAGNVYQVLGWRSPERIDELPVVSVERAE